MGRTHILLLTGAPGVGKTTVVVRLAELLPEARLAGFVTAEERDARGRREGFVARAFDGTEATIANVRQARPPRVGKYGVDVPALDRLSHAQLGSETGADLYLVDEIGKMECLAPEFVRAMTRLLDGPRPIVATVGLRGHGLIADVKRWPGSELWQVTRQNRDALPERALLWLRAHGHLPG